MILSDSDLQKRLNNPLNLLNKPKGERASHEPKGMSLFIKPSIEEKKEKIIPPAVAASIFDSVKAIPPSESDTVTTDELISDVDARVNLELAHDNAIHVMNHAIGRVKDEVNNLDVKRLPSLITAMSKVVTEIQRTKLEHQKVSKGTEVHHHFYMPEQKKLEAYEVIEVAS